MINYFLFLILTISFVTDIRKRKIYNIITLPSIIIGLTYHTYANGWNGFFFSFFGFLLGLGLLLIPYLLGGMGAGDLKLLAAVGALKGSTFVFYSFLFTGLIGGVIALLIMLKEKRIIIGIKRVFLALLLMKDDKKTSLDLLEKRDLMPSFPYGVAIVFGSLSTFFLGGLL